MIERGFGRIVAVASTPGSRAIAYVSPTAPRSTRWSAWCARSRSRRQARASPSTRSAPASPRPISCAGRSDRMVEKGRASEEALARSVQTSRSAGWSSPRRSRRPRCSCARRRRPRSPAPRSRSEARSMMDDRPHSARRRDQGRRAPGRSQDRAAAVAPASHLHDPDRGRDPAPAARPLRRHAAALRPDGAARPGAGRHDAGDLSKRMMVSNGNVTGLVERLVEPGRSARRPLPNDRRAQIISLTPDGQSSSAAWRGSMRTGSPRCSPACRRKDIEELMPLLAKTKLSARQALKNGDAHERGQSRDPAALRLPGPPRPSPWTARSRRSPSTGRRRRTR